MIRIRDGKLYIEDELIELTSEIGDECGIELCHGRAIFDSTKEMLKDLAVHPDNTIGPPPPDFDPPVKRIAFVNGNLRIEGKVVYIHGEPPIDPPRVIVKNCRVQTNGFSLKPWALTGTYEIID